MLIYGIYNGFKIWINKKEYNKYKNPIEIVKSLMHEDFINIHGPEHHFLDGAAFMVSLHNSGLVFNLSESLDKLSDRTIKMPGAMCGFWGIFGSVASIGNEKNRW